MDKVSHLLKGDKRLETETYDQFKIRRKAEKMLVKQYLKGRPVQSTKKDNRDDKIFYGRLVWALSGIQTSNGTIEIRGSPNSDIRC